MKIKSYTNIGSREVNQDYLVSQTFGSETSLHLVADGIGGYECGEIASKVIGDSYVYGISRSLSIEEATEVAKSNLKAEHQALGVSKMGSTVAGILINGKDATIFWAGDSRVYVFRNKVQLYQTLDHSMLNELSKIRQLTFEEKKKYGHIITRSIMGNDDDHVDLHTLTLQQGDEILVCTDGLYNYCPVDYLMESIRTDSFDIDKQNEDFEDNHSLIYIAI